MTMVADMRREVETIATAGEAIRFAAEHFIKHAQQAITSRGSFHVALSGGSTPKALYKLLAAEYAEAIDWQKVVLWWSDERCVAPDDEESNYHMAMENGFKSLQLLDEQIHRMPGELKPDEAAGIYCKLLREKLPEERFDLVMLGMGPDGHTASLFPGTEALTATDESAVANFVESKDAWRLTLTFDMINRARAIVFYALGSGKAEMVAEVLEKSPTKYPAGLVGTEETPALWIIDEGASTSLSSTSLSSPQ